MNDNLQKISQPLLAWYDENARVLPWRNDSMPYHVWVSEIMLQQTRVEAVKEYYVRFVKALPTITSLAEAEEPTLMKLWEGLGYYSRVRNLQKAARIVVDCFSGKIPETYERLRELPGIGDYTAGAIASIAFGQRVPVVDGNVLRVVTRVLQIADNIDKAGTKKDIWKRLQAVMPQGRCGDFNQAMMELGATICVPNGLPKCNVCPVRTFCLGSLLGNSLDFPVKSEKKSRKLEKKTVFILQKGELFALRRRPENGLLAGLWELFNVDNWLSEKEAKQMLLELGFSVLSVWPLPKYTHIFTHMEWKMKGFFISVDSEDDQCGLTWVTKDEIKKNYTMPSAFKGYLKEMKIN